MASADELLKKHGGKLNRGKKKVARKGPKRPWQESLDKYHAESAEDSPVESEKPRIDAKAKGSKESEVEVSVKKLKSSVGESGEKKSKKPTRNSRQGAKKSETLVPFDSTKGNPTTLSKELREDSTEVDKTNVTPVESPDSSQIPALVIGKSANLLQEYQALIRKLGATNGMYYLCLKELADTEGVLTLAQEKVAHEIQLTMPAARKLLRQLCKTGALEVLSEYDSVAKTPRRYSFLL